MLNFCCCFFQRGNLSAVDFLSVTNLVNYFGKAGDIENIEVSPLLLQKGSAQLALFGLGSCRDERLHRLFRKGKVKFLRPKEEEGEWFNVLVLHQNRYCGLKLIVSTLVAQKLGMTCNFNARSPENTLLMFLPFEKTTYQKFGIQLTL